MRNKTVSATYTYSHGYYYRICDRIFLQLDAPLPAGLEPEDSGRIEKNAWENVLGELSDGVSYKIKGWSI